MKRLTSSLLCTVFGAASLFAASNASAALQIELTVVGGSSGTTTYADATDDGIFTVIDADYDGWNVIFTTGIAYPDFNPSTSNPSLLLSSLDATNVSGAGDLIVKLTNTGFGIAAGDYSYGIGSSITSTDPTATVSTTTYFDDGNAAFGTTETLATSGAFNPSTYSDGYNASGSLTTDGTPFSFTIQAVIANTGAGVATTIGSTVAIPEPATIALLGLGLVLVGFATRHRKEDSAQELAA